ncbi:MAG: hypothetical protein RR229_03975 [Oscillospiraceae bacterium]
MDDFKEKENDEELEKSENPQVLDENIDAIKEEMEELAKTFQEELDSAKKELDETPLQNPQSDVEDTTAQEPEKEDIPEDELCECCLEKRKGTAKNPSSPYCDECDAGLRTYPFDWKNIIFMFAILAFSILSCYIFSTHTEILVGSMKAEQLVNEKKLITGMNAYTDVANKMLKQGINGELVYQRELLVAYDLGYMQDLGQAVNGVKGWELSLPHFSKTKKSLSNAESFLATASACNSIMEKYKDKKAEEIPYDEILKKFDELKGQAVPEKVTAEAPSPDETTTKASPYEKDDIKAKNFNDAMISFYKYYIALVCEKDLETQITFLEEIKNNSPEYVWVYAATLGDLYAKTGRDVTGICNTLREFNVEDETSTTIEAIALRVKGDYDGAIKICNEKIEEKGKAVYEFYRQKALNELCKGEFTNAYDSAYNSYQEESYSVQVCDTLALCAAAAKKTETYTQMEELLKEANFDISQEVKDYKDGKIKIEDILLKGDFDIQ